MIHVAYRLWGGDGFFAKMCGTSMLSMFENTQEKVTIHIMHNDRLTPDNRGKFCYIAGQYNQTVKFHDVEKIAGATLRKFEAVHPIASGINAAWYPLIVYEVFPNLEKIIFLGADTVFNEIDVGELWAYDFNEQKEAGYGIGAIPEIWSGVPKFHSLILDGVVEYEDYFNTDVMLLKPRFFLNNLETILEGCRFIYQSNRYDQAEQDVLSYLFAKKYLKIPGKFNLHTNFIRRLSNPHLEKAIYHFAGGNNAKPSLDTDDIFNKLYWEYFLKTPWANADMFGNMDKSLQNIFRQTTNTSKENLLHFTNLLARRQRAFIVDKNFNDLAMNIFDIKDDELVIEASEENFGKNGEKLLEKMNKYKGKKIFFIMSENYWQVGYFLMNQNFVEGTDFVNAFIFLSERHGFKVSFDTKQIVQAM